MPEYYYRCEKGLIVMQTFIDTETNLVSYNVVIINTKGYEVAGSCCMYKDVHSNMVSKNDAKEHRNEIVKTIKTSFLRNHHRKSVVRFNLNDKVFIVEKKPKMSRIEKETEWDTFGRLVHEQGLCEEDTIETIQADERERKTLAKVSYI